MDIKIQINKNSGFKWHERDGISVKGYTYLFGDYIGQLETIDYLLQAKNEIELVYNIKKLNGCFSIIADTKFGLFAFSDTTRSFPLMYAMDEQSLLISDSSKVMIANAGDIVINHPGLLDYLHSGSVFYNETLVDGIKQICAMHYLKADKYTSKISYIRYKSVYDKKFEIFDEVMATQKLKEEFANASHRLINSLDGRMAVVYLSGGVDSRACLTQKPRSLLPLSFLTHDSEREGGG